MTFIELIKLLPGSWLERLIIMIQAEIDSREQKKKKDHLHRTEEEEHEPKNDLL